MATSSLCTAADQQLGHRAGEYRFIGQSVPHGADGRPGLPLYSAGTDFSSLHMIGVLDQDLGGDCMSMFPLPRRHPLNTTAGGGHAIQGAEVPPTHVLMQSSQYRFGVWTDGPVGELSNWTDSFPPADPEYSGTGPRPGWRQLEKGPRYADKDFAAADGRRLAWGWAVVDEGSLGLLRELW